MHKLANTKNGIPQKYAIIDDSSYPVIHINLQKVSPTMEHIDLLFKDLIEVCENHEGRIIPMFVNKTGGNAVNIEVQEYLAFRLENFELQYKGRITAYIIVLPNTLSKLAAKGVSAFYQVNAPKHLFPSEEASIPLIEKLLGELREQ